MKTKKLFYLAVLVLFGLISINSCSSDDDNCTEETWYQDSDGDGFGNLDNSQQSCSQPTGYVQDNTDCDDTDQDVNPIATENTSDGIDNNCNGVTNECNSDSDCPAGMTCVDIGGGITVCQ